MMSFLKWKPETQARRLVKKGAMEDIVELWNSYLAVKELEFFLSLSGNEPKSNGLKGSPFSNRSIQKESLRSCFWCEKNTIYKFRNMLFQVSDSFGLPQASIHWKIDGIYLV